jgi:PAS domain S-box-containing protein
MTYLQRLTHSLNARLIIAMVAVVLLALLVVNGAAFLILRDQLERHSQSSLQQGEHIALLVLDDRKRTLDALAVVLSQRPTLRRFLSEADYTGLSSFLEDFRVQGELDWVAVCDEAGAILAASTQPGNVSLCQPAETSGYRLIDGRPALVTKANVAEYVGTHVVVAQWIDAAFLNALVSASALAHGIVDAGSRERLVATWPAPADSAPLGESGQVNDTTGARFVVSYAEMAASAGADLLLESALPVSDRVAAERRILALLTVSTALSAAMLIAIAVIGVRRANAPMVDALRRSEDAMGAAQAERMAALESLDALIQSIVEGVILTDDDGVVRFVSAGAERIVKMPAATVIGMPIDQLLQLSDGSPFPGDELIAAPGHSQILDLQTYAGERITAAVSATRITQPRSQGRANAYLVRDVTEEEAHSRLRSYFLSSISHEFRTPLSALRASLELLVSEENPLDAAESRQLLRPAYLSVVGLQTLIDNLLTSSTIEAGRFVLHLSEVDLRAILADAVRVVTPLLERRQQQLVVELPATPPIVNGDAAQLTQVLINLLTNASKYSPTGGTVEVSITQHAADAGESVNKRKTVRVAVADNGPGVDPETRAEIFRRFVRRHDNEREQYGVGLGLYVAKSTITAHGGRIDVESRPSGGSIFWFELETL